MAKQETAQSKTASAAAASAHEAVEKITRKTAEKVTKGVENITAFSRETFDAVVQSSTAAAKNVETVFAEVVAFSKKNIEDSVTAAKDIAAVRSPEALSSVHSRYAQQAFENYLSQMTRLGDLFISASKEVSEPISARMSALSDIVTGKKVA